MPIKLSHSAREMLNQCSEKYRLHYLERLRSPRLYSALFFGNALDAGFSRILLEKKKERTEIELALLEKTEEAIFLENMHEFKLNAVSQKLPMNELCEYYQSDFSPEFLPQMEQSLHKFTTGKYDFLTISDYSFFFDDCKEVLKAKKKLSKDDKVLYNYMCWLSLCEKGKLMLKAYREQVFPHIHELYALQKPVSIVNASGDSISGAIDFIASFIDRPNRKYICDNKSSSKAYKANAVLESDQLATYCEAEGMNFAAYVVVQKELFKKAPIIRTQIIKSEIKEQQLQNTFDKFEEAVYTIEEKRFSQNRDACFAYGKKCPYFDICRGKDDPELQVV